MYTKDFLGNAARLAEGAEKDDEPVDPLRLATVYALLAIAQRLDTIADRPTGGGMRTLPRPELGKT